MRLRLPFLLVLLLACQPVRPPGKLQAPTLHQGELVKPLPFVLPFERAYHASQGVAVDYHGHPLVDALARARTAYGAMAVAPSALRR